MLIRNWRCGDCTARHRLGYDYTYAAGIENQKRFENMVWLYPHRISGGCQIYLAANMTRRLSKIEIHQTSSNSGHQRKTTSMMSIVYLGAILLEMHQDKRRSLLCMDRDGLQTHLQESFENLCQGHG